MKNKRLVKGIFGIAGALVLSIVIYQFAYAQTYDTPLFSTTTETGVIGKLLNKVTNQPELQAETVAKFDTDGMTLETLATYNGKDGQPAYVAFEGIIYDLSALADWRAGEHHGVTAGKDITDVFSQSPHSKSILKLAVVVGKVVTEETLVNNNSAQPEINQDNTQVDPSLVQTQNTSSTTPINPSKLGTVTTTSKIWTYDLLSQYNGKNGKSAYIAVDGIIYDVTAVGSWSTGTHHGVTAGKDVTADFASSPHSKSILQQAVIIGRIDYPIEQGSGVTTPVIQTSDDDDHDDDKGNDSDDSDADSNDDDDSDDSNDDDDDDSDDRDND